MAVKEIKGQYIPKETEEQILKFWDKKKIFEKLRKKNAKGKNFSFLDGPITANNPMGVHHGWGRTLKDVFQRFKAMQGFNQRYQNGFDCQGLWVEVEVEKDLGFNSKRDIENFGLDNFSKACRKRVENFSRKQTEQSIRLGQWMDWDNSYYTYDDKNIEAIWYFLKKCHEKGWLYKGTKVLPWCIRCGTSSSKHEMSDEGWAELTHPGVFVKFPIKGRNKEYLLVWTTTAWTLTSNVAAAVHPDLNYVKVSAGEEIFYLSEGTKHCLDDKYSVIETMKGKDLIGLEYASPYEDLPAQKNVIHKIVGWDQVGEEEGTGIVHIAPGCGEEDQELGRKEKLKEIAPLDESGNFIEGFGWLTGKNVSGVAKEIIEDLKKRNLLFKVKDCKHRYPVCWRCKEELVFRLDAGWFIKSDEIRPLMKIEAQKVKWYPEYAGKLMQDWLDNMEDWNISRKRYWGLPLMFFECKCGNLEVIGSLKELREKAVNKILIDKLPELHRPWIDRIKVKCGKCGKEVERIREIGDCWLDAGIVPFSTLRYFEDKKYWKSWFPADLVLEMRAQIRLWFYSQLFMSVTLENVAPYKNVVTHEDVRDEKGRPMHKSLGNAIWFDEAAEKMGSDVMRWIYTTQPPTDTLRFGYTIAGEMYKTLNILFNTINYVKTYCEANQFKPRKIGKLSLADKWILSKLDTLKQNVTGYLENFKYYSATKDLENFLLYDFSRWYIHIIRSKVKPGVDSKEKMTVLNTLYTVALELLKLLSPFIPFLTESLYQDFFRKFEKIESIHLADWPKSNKKLINKKLEESMRIADKIIEASLAARQLTKLKLRWPIQEVVVISKDRKIASALKNVKEILLTMCNAKSVKVLSKEPKGEFSGVEFDFGKVLVPKQLNENLLEEAMIRELIREIQESRKKNNFQVKETIMLTLKSDEGTNEILKKNSKLLCKEVGAKQVVVGKLSGKFSGKLEFDNKIIEISFGSKK
jgi:isoleucyl-tRNA synthetase